MPLRAIRGPPRQPDLPASFVSGRYTVRRFLGEGGNKRVFLAHDEQLDRDVAFALSLSTHPQVVTIFESGDEDGAPYIVAELMGGGDVEGEVEDADGPLPLERTLAIGSDVCRGIQFAHEQGIVHRDLKPGNIWLTADGRAKIGDFGLAVSLDRSRLTQEGMMVGTVDYMPPEQATGGEVTPRADLYSLGAMRQRRYSCEGSSVPAMANFLSGAKCDSMAFSQLAQVGVETGSMLWAS